jgi:hypothetical protein
MSCRNRIPLGGSFGGEVVGLIRLSVTPPPRQEPLEANPQNAYRRLLFLLESLLPRSWNHVCEERCKDV